MYLPIISFLQNMIQCESQMGTNNSKTSVQQHQHTDKKQQKEIKD